MLNIYELETRWLHYKIKSYTPYAMISIVIIAGIIAFSFNINTKNEITKNTNAKDVVKKVIPTVTDKQVILKDTKIAVKQKITEEKHKTIISASFNFMKTINNNSVSNNNTNKTKTKVTRKKELRVEAPKIEVLKSNLINIKRKNTQQDIQEVIKRFKKSNNPVLSLFIAKKYYELKDYNQAYNYALITNGINNDIEESWIIFSKSLFMLNKKDKAMKILEKYIKYSHSYKAKLLLDNIRLGKLK